MYIIEWYTTYLAVSLAVIIWVATTLYRNGRLFLVQAFQGDTELAESISRLLVLGSCAVNIDYVTLALSMGNTPDSLGQAIELLRNKLGFLLIVLGVMHSFNLFVLSRFGSRSKGETSPRSIERRHT